MIKLYDTTLRDGVQREGMSITLEDKLKIAGKLDDLGIHYIEGGYPGSNPKDKAFFHEAKKLGLKAVLVAFGSTRRPGGKASSDQGLQALLAVETPVICLFGKSWDLHVKAVLRTDLDENLRMISDSIARLKKEGREVVFDAEHFFDAYKANPKYTMETLKAAATAGADIITLCDTNGGSLPFEVSEIVARVRSSINIPLGIHAHNDTGCAVANSLMAVKSGAVQVQGTINGYGERCGNANLTTLAADLVLKMGIRCLNPDQLKLLAESAHYVAEIANVSLDHHQPYVGQSAFAHKGGLHADAVNKMSSTYEHIDPGLVGNIQRVLVSELAGKSTVTMKAKELGIDLSQAPETVREILTKVKDLENVGYHFEAADGSFEILMRKATGTYKDFFKLESFRVIMEKREDGKVATEATVKIHARGRRIIATAEGNGPVNALDQALRQVIREMYPAVKDIELRDYKVRVLNQKKGTGAVVRVLIESG
ncbi:MAG TPA: citramalate synthase, partial [Actinobacteria bacterium]|nr:citramalate synthase [Actinomycetes bacterium]HEX21473.1 citramalate synthase [Actinomycetota bacterium]